MRQARLRLISTGQASSTAHAPECTVCHSIEELRRRHCTAGMSLLPELLLLGFFSLGVLTFLLPNSPMMSCDTWNGPMDV